MGAHLKILERGVKEWNEWRDEQPEVRPDLKGAKLRHAKLSGANIRGFVDANTANLGNADLRNAKLHSADLGYVNLRAADLSNAELSRANLHSADLRNAKLSGAYLPAAYFSRVDLSNADLGAAELGNADLNNANLSHLLSRSQWHLIGAPQDISSHEVNDTSSGRQNRGFAPGPLEKTRRPSKRRSRARGGGQHTKAGVVVPVRSRDPTAGSVPQELRGVAPAAAPEPIPLRYTPSIFV